MLQSPLHYHTSVSSISLYMTDFVNYIRKRYFYFKRMLFSLFVIQQEITFLT